MLRQVHQSHVQLTDLIGEGGTDLGGITAKDGILNLGIVETDDLLVSQGWVLTNGGNEGQTLLSKRFLLVSGEQTMFFSQFVSRLEENDIVGIRLVQFTRRIKELTLHLIIFSFEQIYLITPFNACASDGCGEELCGCIANECYLDHWQISRCMLRKFLQFLECLHH